MINKYLLIIQKRSLEKDNYNAKKMFISIGKKYT